MKTEPDFAPLRNLLALKRLETPLDTDIDRFLIEFHRRQRAQLLVPESRLARLLGHIRDSLINLRPIPSMVGIGAFAALAIAAVLGSAPTARLATSDGGAYQLSFQLPSSNSTFAVIPASFTKLSPTPDNLSFTSAAHPSATRFILANTRVAYDATAAF